MVASLGMLSVNLQRGKKEETEYSFVIFFKTPIEGSI